MPRRPPAISVSGSARWRTAAAPRRRPTSRRASNSTSFANRYSWSWRVSATSDSRALSAVDGRGVPVMVAPDGGEPTEAIDEAVEAARFEAALEGPPIAGSSRRRSSDAPSNARLASLRRRYHDLGAANPYAVHEYAEVRARLDALDTQDRDLRDRH